MINKKGKLPNKLMEQFMTTFFGYGNLDAPYWFIGMEEGGGGSFQEINKRLNTWKSLKQSTTVDLRLYHELIGIDNFFGSNPKLQTTWSKLIRIQLRIKGVKSNTEIVREYQSDHLGRSKGENCLLELMPLPSPGIDNWNYGIYSDLSYLQTRQQYMNHLLPNRIRCLRKLIKRHQPKLVLFYGLSQIYLNSWKEIIGADFEVTNIPSLLIYNRECTSYTVCPHPVARGLTNSYFESVGNYLRDNLITKADNK